MIQNHSVSLQYTLNTLKFYFNFKTLKLHCMSIKDLSQCSQGACIATQSRPKADTETNQSLSLDLAAILFDCIWLVVLFFIITKLFWNATWSSLLKGGQKCLSHWLWYIHNSLVHVLYITCSWNTTKLILKSERVILYARDLHILPI